MITFVYIDYKNNRKVLWQKTYDCDISLSKVDEEFQAATGIDATKGNHIGVYWLRE